MESLGARKSAGTPFNPHRGLHSERRFPLPMCFSVAGDGSWPGNAAKHSTGASSPRRELLSGLKKGPPTSSRRGGTFLHGRHGLMGWWRPQTRWPIPKRSHRFGAAASLQAGELWENSLPKNSTRRPGSTRAGLTTAFAVRDWTAQVLMASLSSLESSHPMAKAVLARMAPWNTEPTSDKV